jgi:hypothetical protein
MLEEDEGGEVNLEPEAGGQCEEDDGAQWEGDGGGSEAEETRIGKRVPLKETARRSEGEIQWEEASLQPTEEPYPASPDDKFSDGLKEMVDVGAALKQGRGRPRKV